MDGPDIDDDLNEGEKAYRELRGLADEGEFRRAFRALVPRLRSDAAFAARFQADSQTLVRMIEAGLDPDACDPDEGYLLHSVVLGDMFDVVRALLARGADPALRFGDENAYTRAAGDMRVGALEILLDGFDASPDDLEDALEAAREVGCTECERLLVRGPDELDSRS